MDLKKLWEEYRQFDDGYVLSNVDCGGYDASGEIELKLAEDGKLILTFNEYEPGEGTNPSNWIPKRTFELKIEREIK